MLHMGVVSLRLFGIFCLSKYLDIVGKLIIFVATNKNDYKS